MYSKFLVTIMAVTLVCSGAFAAQKKRTTMKRSEIAQYEGEYLVDGAKVRKQSANRKKARSGTYRGKESTKFTSNRSTKKASRSPASVSARKNAKKSLSNSRGRMARSVKRLPAKRSPSSSTKNKSKLKTAKRKSIERRSAKHASYDDPRLPYVKQTKETELPFISIPNSRVRKNDRTIVMGDPEAMPRTTRVERIAPTEANLERKPAAALSGSFETVEAKAGPREPETFDLRAEESPILAP